MLGVKYVRTYAFVLLFCLAVVPAHADDQLARIRKSGELVVGTEMQFAPFDFLENGQQTGFNKDLFGEIGKELGVRVRFVDLPWASVLPGLEARKFDMVGGPLTATKARMERYAYTQPVADATVGLVKRRDDVRILKPLDITGKIVGACKGSAELEQLKAYAATFSRPPVIREYIDNNQAYADLAAGRIDAVANSITNIEYLAKQRPDTFSVVRPPFGVPEFFAYCTRKDKDSRSLVEALDGALARIRMDGRLAGIQRKWIGVASNVPDTLPVPNF